MKPAILVVAMLSLASDVRAQEYINREFHFAISFPLTQGWTTPEIRTGASGGLAVPQRLLLVARNNTGERVSLLIVDVGDRVSLEDADYRQGFREGNIKAFPSSVSLISESVATFAGVPSYEMFIGGTIQALPMNIRMVSVVANRLQYSITGYASARTRLTDGNVGRVLTSFRFTEPPVVPTPHPSPRSTGELIGRLAAYLLLSGIAVLLIRRILRRKNTNP